MESRPDFRRDIMILSMEGDRTARPFLATEHDETHATFSPDGRWIAYRSTEELERGEMYVRPYPGPDPMYKISNGGGTSPAWSLDGKQLFFKSGCPGDCQMMVVDVSFEEGFSRGRPRVLFNSVEATSGNRNYDVSAAGRFLEPTESQNEPEPATEINVILNWFEELKGTGAGAMIGKTLGHYEITDKLGQGGMGTVWRARDSKLGREVAIKTLPEEFAQDEERLARFEREAKLLASLNHPNIATIHGLEEDNGTRFLVLELVEGDTLAERLKRGAIRVEESLKLALQIAEALEAAHDKGVIHRDLKPANIKVTPDGKIKVLDFGLAKAFAGDGPDVNLSQSPTLSMAATQKGIILGTAAYMSPEQASGDTTDKRADIWSFGVVLFEMLTGRQTFDGKTVSHVLADVLRVDPNWNSLPLHLHPRIRFLLERCLEKESKDLYGDISDARVDIQPEWTFRRYSPIPTA